MPIGLTSGGVLEVLPAVLGVFRGVLVPGMIAVSRGAPGMIAAGPSSPVTGPIGTVTPVLAWWDPLTATPAARTITRKPMTTPVSAVTTNPVLFTIRQTRCPQAPMTPAEPVAESPSERP